MKYLIRQGIMSFRTIRKTCATTLWQLAAGKNKDVESCRRLGGLLQALQHRAAPVSEERRRDWRVEIHHYRAVMARSFLQRPATDVHVWRPAWHSAAGTWVSLSGLFEFTIFFEAILRLVLGCIKIDFSK